jgi:uncharacterized membrane protein YraQ (UPF0718 family)
MEGTREFKKENRKKKKNINFTILFIVFVFLLYLFLFIKNKSVFYSSLNLALKTLIQLLPILFIVLILLILFNLYINKKIINRLINNKKLKYLAFAIAGIISSGPIYIWYPLLKNLKEKGISYGQIATFIYARAIKIPLLPLMAVYLGLKLTLIVISLIFVFSLIIGIAIDELLAKIN